MVINTALSQESNQEAGIIKWLLEESKSKLCPRECLEKDLM